MKFYPEIDLNQAGWFTWRLTVGLPWGWFTWIYKHRSCT